MSEEDDALFWRVDTPTDPVLGEESTDPTLDSTEATLTEGLCLRTTTLPTPVVTTTTPEVKDSTVKVVPARSEQDTKPAVQFPATNTEDADETQEAETAIPRLRQATTGTQTELGDSLPEAKTSNLKETLSEETFSNAPKEATSFGLSKPKDIRVRQKNRRKDNPETFAKVARTEPDLWTVPPFT